MLFHDSLSRRARQALKLEIERAMKHTFLKATDYNLLSPEFCNQCHELIIGVFTPVHRCRNCTYVIHDECLQSAEACANCRESLADSVDESNNSSSTPSSMAASTSSSSASSPAVLERKVSKRPIRHHFVRGNLAVDATCVVCNKLCFEEKNKKYMRKPSLKIVCRCQ